MTRTDPTDRFSALTREWFAGTFAAPTPAQAQAWSAIADGDNTLVIAPTGSGKTLAAFLWAIDRLATEPPPDRRGTRVLYVSPLKALAVDVERNLSTPLTGITRIAERLGRPAPEISVGVRSGDTPAAARRGMLTRPPDILITTPESLFLMLTSAARETLAAVQTVIVDEVHAVAGTKRGAHLALSLERLDGLLDAPAQRIGLSATVRPAEEVARFLVGAGKPATVVAPPAAKTFDLSVRVPVPDMGNLENHSIWPDVEQRIVDLIESHHSSIVFANSRRLAERLTARLNEIHAERSGVELADSANPRVGGGSPAQLMASGQTHGAAPLLARAHHGSVSKEQRAAVEEDLKTGRLKAVVATSSLELGIDMGAVDLVIQVEAPPSVASGLQRIGRAGHQVGEISRGVLFPKHRTDLIDCAVTVQRMARGQIEALAVPANPLDVLAQHTVAAAALEPLDADRWFDAVRRAAPFATLPRSAFEATLDLLSGKYPSTEFAELRPRLIYDRDAGTLTARPGAQRLAVTSGGAIPTAACSPCSWLPAPTATSRPGSANSTRRWSTSPGRATSSRWAPPAGGSPRSPTTGCWWCRRRASRPGCRSGAATVSAARPSWARRSARSPESWAGSAATSSTSVAAPWVSTTTPPTTCGSSSTSSARPPVRCPPTAPGSSNGSVTSSATGGYCCTPRTACGCTARWRWRCRAGCASATASTRSRRPATTASSCACPTPRTTRPAPSCSCSTPTRSSRW